MSPKHHEVSRSKRSADAGDGLTARWERFAVLVSQGWNQSDAYREAFECQERTPKQVWEAASRLRHEPKVAARVAELLAAARVQDVDSVGRTYRDTRDAFEQANSDRNWTAVAAPLRLRLTALGMLRDNVVVSFEESSSDEALVERLSRGDVANVAMLRSILGRREFLRLDVNS